MKDLDFVLQLLQAPRDSFTIRHDASQDLVVMENQGKWRIEENRLRGFFNVFAHGLDRMLVLTGDEAVQLRTRLESLQGPAGSTPTNGNGSREAAPKLLEDTNQLIDRLMADVVGLQSVRETVKQVVSQARIAVLRQQQGLKSPPITRHLVFTGNPGTGKTTIARIIGQLYGEIGVLSKGHFIEADRSELVAGYVGQTAPKTEKLLSEALGGVLLIDEAYSLVPADKRDAFGEEAIATLLMGMENHRDDLVVIVAGYRDEMQRFIESNPGLRSRFGKYIDFPDYGLAELVQIFESFCQRNDYELVPEAKTVLTRSFERVLPRIGELGNARFVRNQFEQSILHHSSRLASQPEPSATELKQLLPIDIPANRTVATVPEGPEQALDKLVGLGTVRQMLKALISQAKVAQLRRERGLGAPPIDNHLVFAGNSGTGKATVAHLLGQLYADLGLLSQGQVIEVGPVDLIGQHIGETAQKTQAVLTKARGGVLFLEAAPELLSEAARAFGEEAIATLLAGMDQAGGDLMVIVAGEPLPMEGFLASHAEVASHFDTVLRFPDYSAVELLTLFEQRCQESDYQLDGEAKLKVQELLESVASDIGVLGNARFVQNLFERVVQVQSVRVSELDQPSNEALQSLIATDIPSQWPPLAARSVMD
jgi:SpoVK/Ycf46/Vps4 family AAA+-type ATPase